jgi:calnexin
LLLVGGERRIPDATASKPEEWDEEAAREVEDVEAEMPAGWLSDEPHLVDDPAAEMPDDWDEEEDGEWEAPKIGTRLSRVCVCVWVCVS